jgi:hypothetical protein
VRAGFVFRTAEVLDVGDLRSECTMYGLECKSTFSPPSVTWCRHFHPGSGEGNVLSRGESVQVLENDEQNRTHRRRVGLGERLSRSVCRQILRSRPLRRRPRRAF